MSRVDRLLDSLTARGETAALIHDGRTISYAELDELRRAWDSRLDDSGAGAGDTVGIKADFTPQSIAVLLALFARRCISVLLPASAPQDDAYLEAAGVGAVWRAQSGGEWRHEAFPATAPAADHPLLARVRDCGSAGLVLFSSGSSGEPKAVLHDMERFLIKFDGRGKALRTLALLLFDHVAGQDTLLYTLSSGGSLVLSERRDPDSVARLIAAHDVEVLPASPTFLKLFCLAGAATAHDMSSLAIVTYGSETMPPETLARVSEAFPRAQLLQKYGTSELGSPRSRSKDRGSLWLSLKDDEIEAKVVDGILWLRSDAAMLGYLNAPNPVAADGWYCTGDRVEVDGEWIRILGRESEMINVGGEKVFPQEVENVLLELDWVADVLVRGRTHPLTGQMVEAVLNLTAPRDPREVRKAVRRHCRERLPAYKVPAKVRVTDEMLTTDRQKKRRRPEATANES